MEAKLLQQFTDERRELVARSTVVVVGIERSHGRVFSGVVWDGDTVVTSAEALAGADSVLLHTATGTLEGGSAGIDLSTDVGVVRVQHGLAPARRAGSDSLSVGDAVLVAGRARGDAVISWSEVQYLGPAWRSRRGGDIAREVRLPPGLDASFQGAGVFNLAGELVAMAVPGPRRRVLGIPVETIARVVAPVTELGYLPQPFLGIRVQPVWLDDDLRAQLDRRGPAVIVTGVEPNSPAAAAGVRFGDLVLSVGDTAVEGPMEVTGSLSRTRVGASVILDLLRAGVRQQAAVVVGERRRA